MFGGVKLTRNVIKRKIIYSGFEITFNGAGLWNVSLYICDGSCNTLDDLSVILSVPNKTKDVNVELFIIITGFYESKFLAKHISDDSRS